MQNRRAFVLTLTAGIAALAVIVGPVIADELFGVITKVDVEGKKLTVMQKGERETIITVTDDTDFVTPKGDTRPLDLEKLAKGVEKAQDAGKKGMFAVITHEKGVASKIRIAAKKKGAPPPKEKDEDK